MYTSQDGEKFFNLTSLKQSKSLDKFNMDEYGWMGKSDTWDQPSTKVYYLYKHGMSNSLHNKFFD